MTQRMPPSVIMTADSEDPGFRQEPGEAALQYNMLQITATEEPFMEFTRAMPSAPSSLKARPCRQQIWIVNPMSI